MRDDDQQPRFRASLTFTVEIGETEDGEFARRVHGLEDNDPDDDIGPRVIAAGFLSLAHHFDEQANGVEMMLLGWDAAEA